MPKIATVQAEYRPGFKGYFQGGRFWPSDKPTRIEIHADTEDGKDPEPRHHAKLGAVNWNMVDKDPRLVKVIEGEGTLPVEELVAHDSDEEKLIRLEAAHVELRREFDALKAELGMGKAADKATKQART